MNQVVQPRTLVLFPGWIGIALMGSGLILGGLLALIFALTRVILPYDEAFLGVSRAELAALNPDLLPYMAHNRGSLAGAMLSLGLLYVQVAYHAMRTGHAWGRHLLILSAGVGFASFLLCLLYGYLDPLHLLVTLVLLSFFLTGVYGMFTPAAPSRPIRFSQREQIARWLLLLVGIGVLAGGTTISLLGATVVFVPQDLSFMDTLAHDLEQANARLVPVIAHDRAAFGGVLAANGIGVIGLAWWGFRPAQRWLWWTFALAGLPGFLTAIGTHLPIGYLDMVHLAPAILGALLYVVALVVSYPVLCRQPED